MRGERGVRLALDAVRQMGFGAAFAAFGQWRWAALAWVLAALVLASLWTVGWRVGSPADALDGERARA